MLVYASGCVRISFYWYRTGPFIERSPNLSHTAEGRRWGSSYRLTMVYGRYHGLTVSWLPALFLLHGHTNI